MLDSKWLSYTTSRKPGQASATVIKLESKITSEENDVLIINNDHFLINISKVHYLPPCRLGDTTTMMMQCKEHIIGNSLVHSKCIMSLLCTNSVNYQTLCHVSTVIP